MKRIHFPTLLMHLLLLLMAGLLLRDYPGFFLGVSILVLLFHAAWSLESKKNLLLAHYLGAGLYLLAQPLGLVTTGGGFYGMGSGFGWFFYGIALACSLALETVIAVVRFYRSQRKDSGSGS